MKKHKTYFLSTLTLILMIPCVGLANNEQIERIKEDYISGDYKAAIKGGEKFLAVTDKSSGMDELYYFLGLAYMKDGNLLRSSDIFEIVVSEFKNSPFKEDAQIALADIAYLNEDYRLAKEKYEVILKINPNTKYKSLLYQRLSQVSAQIDDTAAAKVYRDKVKPELLSREYYSVQVGSFSSVTNAKRLTQRLSEEGFQPYIEEGTSKNKKIFRVKVGKFTSYKEAVSLREQLSHKGYPTKICP